MDTYKLRIKKGSYEIEAEVPKEIIASELKAFRDLLSLEPLPQDDISEANAEQEEVLPFNGKQPIQTIENIDRKHLKPLFLENKDGLITLGVPPAKGERHAPDAILLIALGYQILHNEDQIRVTQLKRSLKESGVIVGRISRVLENDIKQGFLIKTGRGKGGQYRLTNKGKIEAQKLMNDILSQII